MNKSMHQSTKEEQSVTRASEHIIANDRNGLKEGEIQLPGKKSDVITDDTKLSSEKGQDKDVKDNGLRDKAEKYNYDDKSSMKEDKRGNDIEKKKHEDNAIPRIKETTWPQNKMNEANNQQGDKDLMATPGNKNKSEKADNNVKSNNAGKETVNPL